MARAPECPEAPKCLIRGEVPPRRVSELDRGRIEQRPSQSPQKSSTGTPGSEWYQGALLGGRDDALNNRMYVPTSSELFFEERAVWNRMPSNHCFTFRPTGTTLNLPIFVFNYLSSP